MRPFASDLAAMSTTSYVLTILALAASFYLYRTRARNPKGLPLPPGPRGLPWLGPVRDIPQDVAWKVFQEWSKKYRKPMRLF